MNSVYLQKTRIYIGKETELATRATNVSSSCVLKLSEFYYGTNRCLTMDNFFTSVPLAKTLHENSLYILGTLKSNKVLKIA